MTYREAYDSTRNWQRKANLISLFHHKRLLIGKWTIKKTARYFQVSVGKVSEDIRLCLSMEMVKNCKRRSDALLVIKNGNK